MMSQFRVKPTLCQIDSCKAFCEQFEVGKGDLILTNPTYFEGFLMAVQTMRR